MDNTFTTEQIASLTHTYNNTTLTHADAYDANGNINLIAGTAVISSRYNGGEAGVDYDGQYYCSESFQLNNNSGISGPDNMGGGMMGGNGGWGGNRHP